jgi:hypothetical protein
MWNELRKDLEEAALALSAEWVPVGERLPDNMDDVLCMWGDPDDLAQAQAVGYCAVNTDRKWTLHCGLTISGNVTHWQPLPAPPALAASAAKDAQ